MSYENACLMNGKEKILDQLKNNHRRKWTRTKLCSGPGMRSLSEVLRNRVNISHTVKTLDVEFRSYNRMMQDQTVNWAENVSGLWAAKIQFNFRSFPLSSELSEDFPEFSGDFPESFSVEIKRWIAVSGDQTHDLRITDLVLYLSATAAIWNRHFLNIIKQTE